MRILRKVVDGLSYNKMNVFHWHITDSHSFPLELPNSIPELAQYGAYSKHKTYSPEQVKELVEYARVRGVKVLPEFDAPAHVGNGWQVWSPTDFLFLFAFVKKIFILREDHNNTAIGKILSCVPHSFLLAHFRSLKIFYVNLAHFMCSQSCLITSGAIDTRGHLPVSRALTRLSQTK